MNNTETYYTIEGVQTVGLSNIFVYKKVNNNNESYISDTESESGTESESDTESNYIDHVNGSSSSDSENSDREESDDTDIDTSDDNNKEPNNQSDNIPNIQDNQEYGSDDLINGYSSSDSSDNN